jgi:DNA-directed RNA polymerase specialized sigma24 family protein
VSLKYFAGLSHEQVADALGITVRTVERDWRFARAWLQTQWEADRTSREEREP